MEPFILPLQPVLAFLIVLARVGGIVSFAPFWAHKSVSVQIRVLIAFVISLVLTPALSNSIVTPPTEVFPFGLVILGELLVGVMLGIVGRIVFSAFEFAAHFFVNHMGFALAGIVDPETKAHSSAFGIGAQMLALVAMLGANGHHWFLIAAYRSFERIPPGGFALSQNGLDILLRLSASAISVGLSIAAPAVIVLVVMEFGLEFFGRTAPQFQIFVLGFPLKIGVGLFVLGSSLYFLPAAFRDVIGGILVNLDKLLGTF
ncbi:MAG: flagellar biosynthetic protein FliR [Pyrinomonadaceae bacterium]